MSLAACLLLYSLVVAVVGPPLLVRATRRGTAPRLGIATWSVAALSVVGSWVAAAGLTAVEVWHAWGETTQLVSACTATIGATAAGSYGPVAQAGVGVLAVLSALALTHLMLRVARSLLRARRHSHQHSTTARAVGHREILGAGAVVLDAPERAAYCVAGRPATIVVTRGALDVLDGQQLDAVLTHERAHLAGRHHLLVAVSRALAAALPPIQLFPAAATEIARLVEMRADDAAVRRHDGQTVIGALLALSGDPALPVAALGATAVGVVERIERLLVAPGRARSAASHLSLLLAAALLSLGPALVVALLSAGAAVCDFTL
ncbi:MAG: M48 family metalloprotease [Pseudonocardiaceae bacterium]|nr:M48 family metalloprotease [Pseudonocardiaceae bacterium]